MRKPEDVIPHRPPFLFVDEIIELGETYAVGEKLFRPDEFFTRGTIRINQ
jgi:3-hydroxyacyl-[acyl-carrier-protein] dehydratase